MAADTTWDAHWNELYKACAFRALFQPAPVLADMYCQMLGKGQGDDGRRAHSSIGIHVRTGELEFANHINHTPD